jgi:Uma2 family endonuclease
MFKALAKTITFEDFLEWKSDGGCYELHDGVIVEMCFEVVIAGCIPKLQIA